MAIAEISARRPIHREVCRPVDVITVPVAPDPSLEAAMVSKVWTRTQRSGIGRSRSGGLCLFGAGRDRRARTPGFRDQVPQHPADDQPSPQEDETVERLSV